MNNQFDDATQLTMQFDSTRRFDSIQFCGSLQSDSIADAATLRWRARVSARKSIQVDDSV